MLISPLRFRLEAIAAQTFPKQHFTAVPDGRDVAFDVNKGKVYRVPPLFCNRLAGAMVRFANDRRLGMGLKLSIDGEAIALFSAEAARQAATRLTLCASAARRVKGFFDGTATAHV